MMKIKRQKLQVYCTTHRYEGILDFYFDITLQPEETRSYFLSLASKTSTTFFHVTLETFESLWQKNLQKQTILSAFFALMFTLALYNAILFFSTREKVYLYYTFLIFTLIHSIIFHIHV